MLQSNATTGGSFDEEDRTHNTANELTPTAASALALDCDDAGNLRHRYTSSEDAYRYTHDAWGRLVKVEFVNHVGGAGGTEAAKTRCEFAYNGLHFRIVTRTDTIKPYDGVLDEQRLMYYSAAWQLLEEDIDDDLSDADPRDRLMQYVWGPRYIDDIIMRRENRNLTNDSPTVTYDYNRYYLTDEQFSVVAILNAAAKLMERVTYDPYGTPRHHWPADFDGDRAITSGEISALYTLAAATTTINDSGYIPDADINRDGEINSSDYSIISAVGPRAALAEGVLTIPFGVTAGANPEANIIGFSSYLYHEQMGEYHVRFRVYNTHLGRWIEHDPLGYQDSMNFYGYIWGDPLSALDPFGLDGAAVCEDELIKALEKYLRYAKARGIPPEGWLQEIAEMLDDADGLYTVRYIYVEGHGWIDLKHFFAAARYAYAVAGWWAWGLGWGMEWRQWFGGSESGHPFGGNEDMRSNYAGAGFGRIYDPDGDLIEQLLAYLQREYGRIISPPGPAPSAAGSLHNGGSGSESQPSGEPAPAGGHSGKPLNCPSNVEWPGGPRTSLGSM